MKTSSTGKNSLFHFSSRRQFTRRTINTWVENHVFFFNIFLTVMDFFTLSVELTFFFDWKAEADKLDIDMPTRE